MWSKTTIPYLFKSKTLSIIRFNPIEFEPIFIFNSIS